MTTFNSKEEAIKHLETYIWEWFETMNELDLYYGFMMEMSEIWLKLKKYEMVKKCLSDINRTFNDKELLLAIEAADVASDECGLYDEYFEQQERYWRKA